MRFIFLDGSKKLIAERLATRKHEFMNPKLLDSQLATLETPIDALQMVNDRPPEEIVKEILAQDLLEQVTVAEQARLKSQREEFDGTSVV